MSTPLYAWMTAQQAADALEEFLAGPLRWISRPSHWPGTDSSPQRCSSKASARRLRCGSGSPHQWLPDALPPGARRPPLPGLLLPALPLHSVYQPAHGRDPVSGAEMLEHAHRPVTALRSEGPEAAMAEEPLVTVVAEVDCFDVGVRADIAEQHPKPRDRLVEESTDRDGVESIHRYGPAAVVVNAPSWEELRPRMWLTLWLRRHLHR